MEEKVWELIMKLPKENITNLLFLSLDEMRSWNGRTRGDCILRAIGAELNDRSWKIPSMKKIKEITDSFIGE